MLYDMCVLMSATAPNSCKLAVYESEVLRKSTTFLTFTPSGEGKKSNEGGDHSDVALSVKTHGGICASYVCVYSTCVSVRFDQESFTEFGEKRSVNRQ